MSRRKNMRTCAQTCALPEVALQSFGLITQPRLSARFNQPRPASATSRLSGYTASSHCVPFRAALYAINHHVHRYVRVRACHILDAPSTKRSRYDRVHRAPVMITSSRHFARVYSIRKFSFARKTRERERYRVNLRIA